MKRILFLISLLLLSSCTLDIKDEKVTQIRELEATLSGLKIENQKLTEENQKLKIENQKLAAQTKVPKKAETIDSEFGPITPINNGFSAPEEMSYKEVSNKDCIEKAQAEYLKLGNQQCQQMGFSTEDIKAKKCKLTKEFIDVITKKLQDAVTVCGPGI